MNELNEESEEGAATVKRLPKKDGSIDETTESGSPVHSPQANDEATHSMH